MVIPPFTPCPAIGDAFIGRQGLVRNLRRRIARGESLAVIGGPKLGKTSLVRTALQGLTSHPVLEIDVGADPSPRIDRKSTRLNSSHVRISYAVFCLKKKKTILKARSTVSCA